MIILFTTAVFAFLIRLAFHKYTSDEVRAINIYVVFIIFLLGLLKGFYTIPSMIGFFMIDVIYFFTKNNSKLNEKFKSALIVAIAAFPIMQKGDTKNG